MARSSICGFSKQQVIKNEWDYAEKRADSDWDTKDNNKQEAYRNTTALYGRTISVLWGVKRVYTKLGSSVRELDPADICGMLKIIKAASDKKELEKSDYAFFMSFLRYNYRKAQRAKKNGLFIDWKAVKALVEISRRYARNA